MNQAVGFRNTYLTVKEKKKRRQAFQKFDSIAAKIKYI